MAATKPYDPLTALRALPHPPPVLHEGSGGWAVRLLHRLLAEHAVSNEKVPAGWRDPAQPVPDLFDGLTRKLVLQFQQAAGLGPDGMCDPATWAWLGCRDRQALGEVALAFARHEAYAGAREIGGNNRGPYVRKYTGGHEGDEWEWCAAYAVWCLRQARARLKLDGMPWLKTNPFSSSKLVLDAAAAGRLLHPAPVQTASEHRYGIVVRQGQVRPGDLCIVRGGKTGYRHTTLLDHIENGRAFVMEGNVNPARYILALIGIKTGIARPGSYRLEQVVFVQTA